MKKTYKLITAFIVLLSLVTLKMGAQISGVVTVNSALATNPGVNYQSFTALATALNTGGINGPLTVNVVSGSGPYTEQPSFNVISGVSVTNTITVNGNGCLLQFNSGSSTAAWTLNLNGADRMFWNNLNVIGTGATYAYVCLLSNGADYNTFTACTFSCPITSVSSSHYPLVFSGLNTAISAANSANFTTVKTCTLSGGLYGAYMYGLTAAPYQTNNTLDNCKILDWSYMGIYCYYEKNAILRGNIISRPARTTYYTTTCYGMYVYYNTNALIEQNRVTGVHDGAPTTSNSFYAIYFSYTPVSGAETQVCRNNVIADIKSNGGTLYGILAYYPAANIYHNTISFDQTGSTGGTTYGIYSYGQPGYYMDIRNNLISITRGASTRYGFYAGGVTGNITVNRNNYWISGSSGTNYTGYYTAAATTLANLQSQGIEPNGLTLDPMYTALPTNVIPTSASLNNLGNALGVAVDNFMMPRSGTTPDIGAHEFLSANCNSAPTATSVTTPTYAVCLGEIANLALNGYTSDLGIVYQWVQSTTSAVGPWTVIPGANSVLYTTPGITQNIWYGVAMNCTMVASGQATAVGAITVAGITTHTAPYFENFDQIPSGNKLPNCSWSAPNLGTSALTYTSSNTLGRTPRSGTSFASFFYSPVGANHFYTNGIYLSAGITYSAAVWYQTEYYGYNNFTDLSILYGPNQSTTGLVSIATTGGPAVSNVYKPLSNTFTVPASGLYYVAIRATSTSGSAQYLSWDDLSITIPCQVNSPTLSVNSSTTGVCAGDPVILTASGASTYTWNTGATTNILNETPANTTVYTVVGASALSGCTSTMTQMITVNPSPVVLAYASAPTVCSGQPVTLNAISAGGGVNFVWNTGAPTAFVTLTPTVSATYTVLGTNSYGCVGMATQAVAVNALPSIAVTSSQPNDMCVGEMQTLTATGGATYQWFVGGTGAMLQGNPVTINPTSTTVYTVSGTNANGCSNKATITQNVTECLSIKENNANSVNVYPNPTTGALTIESNNASEKTILVMDVTGRIISSSTNSLEVVNVDLSNLSNGIYYVKIQSSTSLEVVKVVKH